MQPPKKKKTGLIIVIVAAAVVVVGGGGTGLYFALSGGSADSVAQDYVDAVNQINHDPNSVDESDVSAIFCGKYSNKISENIKQTKEKWSAASPEERKQSQSVQFVYKSVDEKGDKATVHIERTIGSGEPEQGTVPLIKENGEWKVCPTSM